MNEPLGRSQREQYLFESFLAYRDALSLCRWVGGVLKLSRLVERGGPIQESLCWAAGHNGRVLFPQLRPAGTSVETFERTLADEHKRKSLSAEALNEMMEKEAEELRTKIDSGAIDIWDDTPVWVDKGEVRRFVDESQALLSGKIRPACNREISFFENLVALSVDALEEPDLQARRFAEAMLLMWDYGRMYYEGEPPYKVVFSSQVAEALGIDPEMESLKFSRMPPLRQWDRKRLWAAMGIAQTGFPAYGPEIKQIVEQCGLKVLRNAGKDDFGGGNRKKAEPRNGQ